MLTKRQKTIINHLCKSSGPITAQKLADLTGSSPRTIKRDMKEIIDQYPDILISGRDGYLLSLGAEIPDFQESEVPDSFESRRKYILKKLILNETLSLDTLSEDLYISPVTLQNELNEIRTELKNLSLNLHIKQYEITLSGSDRGRRKLLQEFINDELSTSSFYNETIQNYLPDTDVPWLIDTITDVLRENELFLDNYALTNYATHLAILIATRKSSSEEESVEFYQKQNPISIDCEPILLRLKKLIEEHYKKTLSLSDLYEASFLMLTRISHVGYQTNPNAIDRLITAEAQELVSKIINEVRLNYSIDLDNPDFIVLFSFHIKNLLIRLRNHLPIVNVQFKQIKIQFPMLYSISVYIAKRIEEFTGYEVNEDEIAFITIHIGTIIEQEQQIKKLLTCILYAPNYYSIGDRISSNLKARFPDDLYIADIVTDGNQFNLAKNIDLIISTTELTNFRTIPYVVVTPFFTETDAMNCFNIIEHVKFLKKKKKILSNVDHLFNEKCFFLNLGLQNRKNTIDVLCDKMYSLGFVNEDYQDTIYERENISSTAFGYVAIPHPLNNDSPKSLVAVAIEKNGIQWGKSRVNIVFLLSIRKEDRKHFRAIFDLVTMLTGNEKSMKQITHVTSYQEFLHILNSEAVINQE